MSTLSCEQKLKTTLERFRQTAAPIHVGPIVRNMVVDMAVDEQLPGSRALQTTS
jgi:succinate dehydrogenase/fumarate reductase-like Fe-S protein